MAVLLALVEASQEWSLSVFDSAQRRKQVLLQCRHVNCERISAGRLGVLRGLVCMLDTITDPCVWCHASRLSIF
jgi:hypothetical protein